MIKYHEQWYLREPAFTNQQNCKGGSIWVQVATPELFSSYQENCPQFVQGCESKDSATEEDTEMKKTDIHIHTLRSNNVIH